MDPNKRDGLLYRIWAAIVGAVAWVGLSWLCFEKGSDDDPGGD